MESRTHASLLGRLGLSPDDPSAWTDFVRRYGPRILGWCRHWGLQEADAEDITQNVLLRVAKQMQTFRYDPSKSFRAWLKTVTRAAWADWRDAQKGPRGSGDTGIQEALAGAPARDDLVQRLEEEFDRELLELAIAKVRLRVEPNTWEAFRLQAIEGLSGAEAAAKIGINVGTAFVAKGRVQKLIQEELKALEGSPE
jgi:RNA polymerase sigma-70 factor (ECF subfamily)